MLRYIKNCAEEEAHRHLGKNEWSTTLDELDAFISILYARGNISWILYKKVTDEKRAMRKYLQQLIEVLRSAYIHRRKKLNSSQILKQWTLTSNVSVCSRTVRGRLLEIGLRGSKARPKPLLTEFQRKRRLTWAREHSLWSIKGLEKLIFSDESQFCISGNHSCSYVRRHTHEEFSPQCLKPTVKYPTKVMVWGSMSSHRVGRLHLVSGTVKAMDYIEILHNKLLSTARDLFGNQSWIFQDDNAPCHRAKVFQKWLKDHTVNRMN
ncbi:transposable element Tcb1 transposase [Trichonephila clavipes]|nr:transposable element Tcb1 transposase [Trichonephila clavipes]